MKKNVSGQVTVAQLVSKTDGSAVTSGTTTVYVLGDGGTQATGSVGSGAATHEGNGVWSYAPAQAETNYDHVAFTFVNSSAINATIQIYTSFPQTGDNFARLGAPAGASVSADVAAVKSVLPAALVSGRIDASVGAMASGVLTATAIASDAITAAKIADGAIDAATFAAGAINAAAIAADAITDAKVASDVTIASVTGSVGSVTGNVGGNVAGSIGSLATQAKADVNAEVDTAISDAALATAANLATVAGYIDTEVAAIKAKTDNLPSDPADASVVAGLIAAVETKVDTIDGIVDAILVDTAEIGAAGAGLTALASASALSTVAGYVDTEVGAIKAVTDKLDDTLEDDGGTYRFTAAALAEGPSGGSAPTTAQIADKILGRSLAGGADGGRTVSDALRSLRNKSAISGGTLTVYEEDDSTPAWTATVTTAAGDPLSSIDPA